MVPAVVITTAILLLVLQATDRAVRIPHLRAVPLLHREVAEAAEVLVVVVAGAAVVE